MEVSTDTIFRQRRRNTLTCTNLFFKVWTNIPKRNCFMSSEAHISEIVSHHFNMKSWQDRAETRVMAMTMESGLDKDTKVDTFAFKASLPELLGSNLGINVFCINSTVLCFLYRSGLSLAVEYALYENVRKKYFESKSDAISGRIQFVNVSLWRPVSAALFKYCWTDLCPPSMDLTIGCTYISETRQYSKYFWIVSSSFEPCISHSPLCTSTLSHFCVASSKLVQAISNCFLPFSLPLKYSESVSGISKTTFCLVFEIGSLIVLFRFGDFIE